MLEVISSNWLGYIVLFGKESWHMLVEMAPYMCLGFFMAGVLHIFVNPKIILRFLGKGRIKSVLYATFLGIPLPLCSCGVLPAAAGLKKQGANDGASMAFMIATPETGVDSMAVTYALLDPIMTIFRPLAAFCTSIAAGLTQNFFGGTYSESKANIQPDLTCRIDQCCDGIDCSPEEHRHHHSFMDKMVACLKYGFGEILDDISKWLILGIGIAAAISILVPDSFMKTYLDGGVHSMLIMLVIGIPFYICATSSTPIAAALILKGVSPGAALVFLLAGPATNAATISVVYGLFKKRATIIYITSIAVSAVLMGLTLDYVYAWFNISASSVAGEAGEFIPHSIGFIFAGVLAILIANSIVTHWLKKRRGEATCCDHDHGGLAGGSGCGHNHGDAHAKEAAHDNCGCGHDHGVLIQSGVNKPVGLNHHADDHKNCGHDHGNLIHPGKIKPHPHDHSKCKHDH